MAWYLICESMDNNNVPITEQTFTVSNEVQPLALLKMFEQINRCSDVYWLWKNWLHVGWWRLWWWLDEEIFIATLSSNNTDSSKVLDGETGAELAEMMAHAETMAQLGKWWLVSNANWKLFRSNSYQWVWATVLYIRNAHNCLLNKK